MAPSTSTLSVWSPTTSPLPDSGVYDHPIPCRRPI
ncbi:hypothetical protein LINPERPRIM_LOCUS2350 [Linum perenne]